MITSAIHEISSSNDELLVQRRLYMFWAQALDFNKLSQMLPNTGHGLAEGDFLLKMTFFSLSFHHEIDDL